MVPNVNEVLHSFVTANNSYFEYAKSFEIIEIFRVKTRQIRGDNFVANQFDDFNVGTLPTNFDQGLMTDMTKCQLK